MLSFNSTKGGLLKNIQKHLSRCFGSREMSKTKVGTFFETPSTNPKSLKNTF